jgi:hypothetical protein
MILFLASVLVFAASPADLPKASTASGLVSTGQMTVRAVVVDRCTVGPAGATCDGVAPIRPMSVDKGGPASRIAIVF